MKRVLRGQTDFRPMTLRNQLTSLILFENLTTTRSKAKDLISYANQFFNRAKPADLTAKKLAHQRLLDKNAIRKLFEDLLPRYGAEETTFVRSFAESPRRGDNAALVSVYLLKPLAATIAKPAVETKKATKTK